MSTIIEQINKMKEQLGISASKEELLGYFTQPSYEEARLAWENGTKKKFQK